MITLVQKRVKIIVQLKRQIRTRVAKEHTSFYTPEIEIKLAR